MLYSYMGVVDNAGEIVSLSGVCEADTMEEAYRRLTASGLTVMDLRELTAEDLKIERLKRLRDRLSGKPSFESLPRKKEKWIWRFLRWVLRI